MLNLKTISTGSKGNAYVLKNNNDILLLDLGVTVKEIKKEEAVALSPQRLLCAIFEL